MTLITRYDPFREFATLQDRMNRLFREPAWAGRSGRSADHDGVCSAG